MTHAVLLTPPTAGAIADVANPIAEAASRSSDTRDLPTLAPSFGMPVAARSPICLPIAHPDHAATAAVYHPVLVNDSLKFAAAVLVPVIWESHSRRLR
mgnify:CR=1 FL=1